MANFALRNILPNKDSDFNKGVFVILFNVTAIPPHLLLSVDGKIYSITDSGKQMGSSLEKFLGFIKRKKNPTIFIEWVHLTSLQLDNFSNLTIDVFKKYDRVVEGKVSCLFPIREVVSKVLGNEMNSANFIFELLPMMEKANALGKVYQLNMEELITNGEFELLTYTNINLREGLQPATL